MTHPEYKGPLEEQPQRFILEENGSLSHDVGDTYVYTIRPPALDQNNPFDRLHSDNPALFKETITLDYIKTHNYTYRENHFAAPSKTPSRPAAAPTAPSASAGRTENPSVAPTASANSGWNAWFAGWGRFLCGCSASNKSSSVALGMAATAAPHSPPSPRNTRQPRGFRNKSKPATTFFSWLTGQGASKGPNRKPSPANVGWAA